MGGLALWQDYIPSRGIQGHPALLVLGGGGVGVSQAFSPRGVQLVLPDSHIGFISPGGLGDSLVGSAPPILGGLLGALPRASPKSQWPAGPLDFPMGDLWVPYKEDVWVARVEGGSGGGPCRDPLPKQPLRSHPDMELWSCHLTSDSVPHSAVQIARSLGCEGLKGDSLASTCCKFLTLPPQPLPRALLRLETSPDGQGPSSGLGSGISF